MLLSSVSTFIALLISAIVCIISFIIIYKKIKPSQIKVAFLALNASMIICCTGLLLQNMLSIPLGIDPIYFEYFIYIGNSLLPITFFFTALIFTKTKINMNKKYLLLFVIPIISMIFLLTNNMHHLFYVEYSVDLSQNVYGPVFAIFDAYILILYAISIVMFLKQSISSSGLFSMQAILFIIGSAIPVVQNILSTTQIITTTIYITPICFTVMILFISLAVFKFKFLSTTPVALRTIVDRISDGYVVLNENFVITDANETFLEIFNLKLSEIVDTNILSHVNLGINLDKLAVSLSDLKNSNEILTFETNNSSFTKTFTVEVSNIFSKEILLGILILFKDTTQHTKDMKTIRDNQDMLIEKERLASLGQMIGGIAHNLKTPIMSISGAVEGLNDLVTEYEASVGDSDVTIEDHHAIAKDMKNWLEKIKTHMGYMSDVITAVKGQAVTFSEEQSTNFTVNEMLKMVSILMKHELNSALVTLNIQNNVSADILLHGNINSLVQVINNVISNAIQASTNAQNKTIDFAINRIGDNIIMSIRDYGCGMPLSIQETLFKKMVTTKGKNGTGLGLFMSYSNIKAHFNGDIAFESEEGKGTQFDIILPL